MRNRYLDLLRAAAIVRVIVYHLFGWPWLSIVLPAMGIMFALAGSLAAASLDKRAAGKVITSRLRRLLPPLWLLGLIAVPLMLAAGWTNENGEHPFSVPRLLFWLLPLGDPPGSEKGVDAWEPLWYLRAYVWFILLSPIMYAVYRKIGWFAVAAPVVLIGVLDKTGFSLPDTADAALWDFVTYGACWITGFAHHDGRLARLRPGRVITVAVLLGGAALYWLQGHQGEDAWDLNDVSESQALWSLAFVLLALRWQPPMQWLSRHRALDIAVTIINERAVTVYLWHNIAIAAVWPVLTVLALDDIGDHLDGVVDLGASLALTLVAVVLFGWVEDLAARRRPRLWPGPSRVRARRTAGGNLAPSDIDGAGAGAPVTDENAYQAGSDQVRGNSGPVSPGITRPRTASGGRHTAVEYPHGQMPELRMPDLGMPASGLPASGLPASGLPASGLPDRGMPDRGMPVAGRRASELTGPSPIDGRVPPPEEGPAWPRPRRDPTATDESGIVDRHR